MSLFSDIGFWFDIIKWAILLWVAYYYYTWAREHLPFSPLMATVVGIVLVYYLVIEHPLFGAIGAIGWAIISSGFLLLLPSAFRLFGIRR